MKIISIFALSVLMFFPNPIQAANTRLFKAVQKNKIDLVKKLVKNESDANTADRHGKPVLWEAVKRNHYEIAKYLISRKANIEARYNNNFTPLMVVAQGIKKIKIAKLLLDNGAKINAVDLKGNTSLIIAVKRFHYSFVEYLLTRGADVNHKNNNHKTALMFAAQKSDGYKIIKGLLRYGADVNAQTPKGETALLYAIQKLVINSQRTEYTATLLINNGAHVNVNDIYGSPILIKAIHIKNKKVAIEIVSKLLEAGANVNKKSEVRRNLNETALMVAARMGKIDLVNLLLQNGADPNLKDIKGNNAINKAKRYSQIIALLKKSGCRIDGTSSYIDRGFTLLKEKRYEDAAEQFKIAKKRIKRRDFRTNLGLIIAYGGMTKPCDTMGRKRFDNQVNFFLRISPNSKGALLWNIDQYKTAFQHLLDFSFLKKIGLRTGRKQDLVIIFLKVGTWYSQNCTSQNSSCTKIKINGDSSLEYHEPHQIRKGGLKITREGIFLFWGGKKHKAYLSARGILTIANKSEKFYDRAPGMCKTD
jgi:ankyrin repeat protein